MQTEIEVKFLDIHHDNLRAKLKQLGARLDQPMRLMRRAVFDWPGGKLEESKDGFLRVRDEGHQITMTYKVFNERTVDGAGEVELVIDDYQKAVALLEAIGMVVKSEQESRREAWHLDDCEIVLDEWPWIKPYIEIEGPSQNQLRLAAKKLGLQWGDAVFGSVTTAYRGEYDIPYHVSIGEQPVIAFGDPVPNWLQKLRRSGV